MLLCVIKPSTKRCIRNFHVEVVQGGKGNAPKTHSERTQLLYGFFDVLAAVSVIRFLELPINTSSDIKR